MENQWSADWRRRFAFLPTQINGTTVWLEPYEERYVELDHGFRCELKMHFKRRWHCRTITHREKAEV